MASCAREAPGHRRGACVAESSLTDEPQLAKVAGVSECEEDAAELAGARQKCGRFADPISVDLNGGRGSARYSSRRPRQRGGFVATSPAESCHKSALAGARDRLGAGFRCSPSRVYPDAAYAGLGSLVRLTQDGPIQVREK